MYTVVHVCTHTNTTHTHTAIKTFFSRVTESTESHERAFKTPWGGAVEISQQLRVLATLAEDLILVPSYTQWLKTPVTHIL